MLDLDSLNLLVPDPPLQETSQLQQLSISDDEQVDLDGDQLMAHGVQEDHIVSTTPMYLRNIQLLHQYQSQHLPHVSSPLRNSTFESSQIWPTSSNEEDDLMDVDCYDEDQEGEEEQNTSILGKSIVENVGLILSPTLLGAKVATQGNISLEANSTVEQEQQEETELGYEKSQTRNSDDGRTENQSSTHEETNESTLPETTNDSELLDEEEEEEEEEATEDQSNTNEGSFSTDSTSSEQDSTTSGYSSSNYTRDSADQTPRQRFNTLINEATANKTPIQFQMHHHHYYFANHNNNYNNNNNTTTPILPPPWSNTSHPKSPTTYMISTYLQLLFNTLTSCTFLYFLYQIIQTVRQDIEMKMDQQTLELSLEIASCARSYVENRCSPETRAHALEEICNTWESCMNKDPEFHYHNGRSQISAELFGLILNSLIEPIGWKALLVCGVGVLLWSFGGNFMFGFVRAKSYYQGWEQEQDHHHKDQQQQVQRFEGLRRLEPVYSHHYQQEPTGGQDQNSAHQSGDNWALQ